MAQVWTHIGGEALERWSGRPARKAASQVWSLHRDLEVRLQTTEGIEEDREAEAPKVRAQGATNLEKCEFQKFRNVTGSAVCHGNLRFCIVLDL